MPCCIAAASAARGRVVDLDPEAVGVRTKHWGRHRLRGDRAGRAAGHGAEGHARRLKPRDHDVEIRRRQRQMGADAALASGRRVAADQMQVDARRERVPADRPPAHRVLDLVEAKDLVVEAGTRVEVANSDGLVVEVERWGMGGDLVKSDCH